VLISLLQNNNNIIPATVALPTVIVDRGGSGPQWPGYDIVDIQGALSSFVEISGENPIARAVRRQAHIGQHLDALRDRRERREGAAFLAGAALAESAAQEKISDLLRQVSVLKTTPVPAPAPASLLAPQKRGTSSDFGLGAGLFLLGAGIVIGIAISKSGSKPRPLKKRSAHAAMSW
jgi:hypothetical protein